MIFLARTVYRLRWRMKLCILADRSLVQAEQRLRYPGALAKEREVSTSSLRSGSMRIYQDKESCRFSRHVLCQRCCTDLNHYGCLRISCVSWMPFTAAVYARLQEFCLHLFPESPTKKSSSEWMPHLCLWNWRGNSYCFMVGLCANQVMNSHVVWQSNQAVADRETGIQTEKLVDLASGGQSVSMTWAWTLSMAMSRNITDTLMLLAHTIGGALSARCIFRVSSPLFS